MPMQKFTIEEMREIARGRGGQCLSPRYIGSHVKLTWQCKDGHQWDGTPANIKQGRWCPACVGLQRGTVAKMREMAKQKGGRCLSTEYTNSDTKLTWQCKEGHQWEAVPTNIKQGTWCPVCTINAQKDTIKEMQKIAGGRGGKCLSEKYISSQTKLTWQCKEGHKWEAVPANIKQGSWCPLCAGKQMGTIEEMRSIARARGGQCLSLTYMNSSTKLTWQCKNGHQWEAAPGDIKRGRWCLACAGLKSGTIEEMQKIAGERGGLCISKKYINSRSKLTWQCKEAHQWEASPHSVQQGHWCAVCAGKQKGTIGEMLRIATERGGLCLSKEYTGTHVKLTWQCKEGHQWRAAPANIKRGSWCPLCAGKKRKIL
jgi:hypothetical protein